MDLAGKVAIVTGASRGVGAATAVRLARAGSTVVCAARSTREQPQPTSGTLDETVDRIREAGGTALAVPTNLAIESDVERLVEETIHAFGGVDVLVNNAAITFPGDVDLAMKRFDLIFAVGVRAAVQIAQLVVPSMRARGGGSIVNVSSLAALNYFPSLMAYGMAKAALEHHTMSLSAQLAADKIAVNTFRIDVPVASEGFVANAPDLDHSHWEPPEVAADGIVWIAQQAPEFTGHQLGMAALRDREQIMTSRVSEPVRPASSVTVESHLVPPRGAPSR